MQENFKKIKSKYKFFYLLLLISFIVSLLFVYNNHKFYNQPIAKVVEVTIIDSKEITDSYGNKDEIVTQKLIAKIQNGENKGEKIKIKNEYSTSGAYDFPYKVGNELFITITQKNETLIGRVKEIKRDKYILLAFWVFILTLLFVGKKKGLFATISLAINTLILSWTLDLYIHQGFNLLWLNGLAVILFTVLSLLLMNGRNGKTYAAIVTTILGTFLSLLITFLSIWFTDGKGLYYEEMSFLTRPYQLVFFAGLFIGALGAVMDVAISISSTLYEFYQKDPQISNQVLKTTGFNIGRDIMGTMTNILFFAYISGSIPIMLVYFKNASPLGFALSQNLSLEIARALAGGIGIVLTIPIGVYTSIFFINRRRRK